MTRVQPALIGISGVIAPEIAIKAMGFAHRRHTS